MRGVVLGALCVLARPAGAQPGGAERARRARIYDAGAGAQLDRVFEAVGRAPLRGGRRWPPGVREVRLLWDPNWYQPAPVLWVRRDGARVAGWLGLWWPRGRPPWVAGSAYPGDDTAAARREDERRYGALLARRRASAVGVYGCGLVRGAPHAEVCEARPARPIDWARVLDSLEVLGVEKLSPPEGMPDDAWEVTVEVRDRAGRRFGGVGAGDLTSGPAPGLPALVAGLYAPPPTPVPGGRGDLLARWRGGWRPCLDGRC